MFATFAMINVRVSVSRPEVAKNDPNVLPPLQSSFVPEKEAEFVRKAGELCRIHIFFPPGPDQTPHGASRRHWCVFLVVRSEKRAPEPHTYVSVSDHVAGEVALPTGSLARGALQMGVKQPLAQSTLALNCCWEF